MGPQHRFLLFTTMIIALALASACSGRGDAADGGQTLVGVVGPADKDMYWGVVEGGVRAAAMRLGAEVQWSTPLGGSEPTLSAVRAFAELEGAGAVILAPQDAGTASQALAIARENAAALVLWGPRPDGFTGGVSVSTPPGHIAGAAVASSLERLGPGGGVLVAVPPAEGAAGSATWRDAVRAVAPPGVQVVMLEGLNPPAELAAEFHDRGLAEGEQPGLRGVLLVALAEGHHDRGVMASELAEMLDELSAFGLRGQWDLVATSLQPGEDTLRRLADGEFDVLVTRDPARLGYEAGKAAVALARGEAVDPDILAPPALLTPDTAGQWRAMPGGPTGGAPPM